MKRSMCNLHFTVNSVQSFSPLASRHRFFLIPVLHSLVCTSGPTSSRCLPTPPPSFSQSIPTDWSTANNKSYCNLLIQYFAFNPIKRHQSIDRNQSTDRKLPPSTSPTLGISAIARTIIADWIAPHFVIALTCIYSSHRSSTSPTIWFISIAHTIIADWIAVPSHSLCIDLSQRSSISPSIQFISIASTIVANWISQHFVISLALYRSATTIE